MMVLHRVHTRCPIHASIHASHWFKSIHPNGYNEALCLQVLPLSQPHEQNLDLRLVVLTKTLPISAACVLLSGLFFLKTIFYFPELKYLACFKYSLYFLFFGCGAYPIVARGSSWLCTHESWTPSWQCSRGLYGKIYLTSVLFLWLPNVL